MWAIKIGFNLIFPNLPPTLERFLVCSSNITATNLAAKFQREQLFTHSFFINSALKNPPLDSLLDVATSSTLTTGGGCRATALEGDCRFGVEAREGSTIGDVKESKRDDSELGRVELRSTSISVAGLEDDRLVVELQDVTEKVLVIGGVKLMGTSIPSALSEGDDTALGSVDGM